MSLHGNIATQAGATGFVRELEEASQSDEVGHGAATETRCALQGVPVLLHADVECHKRALVVECLSRNNQGCVLAVGEQRQRW